MSGAVQHVLAALEAVGCAARQSGSKFMARCPAHDDHMPSLSVSEGRDGVLLKCWAGCETERVLEALGLTWRDLFNDDHHGSQAWPRAPKSPTPPPNRPPLHEVLAVWDHAVPVTDDDEATTYLRSRGIDPDLCADRDLCRVIRPNATLPGWASLGGTWSTTGYRLLFALYDSTGSLTTLHARSLVGSTPKGAFPAGFQMGGAVFADPAGRMMLANRELFGPLWIVEGAIDFLTAAASWSDCADTSTLAVVAGSWTGAIAGRVPDGARVVLAVHHDAAGEAYAARIAATLAGRVRLVRWAPARGDAA